MRVGKRGAGGGWGCRRDAASFPAAGRLRFIVPRMRAVSLPKEAVLGGERSSAVARAVDVSRRTRLAMPATVAAYVPPNSAPQPCSPFVVVTDGLAVERRPLWQSGGEERKGMNGPPRARRGSGPLTVPRRRGPFVLPCAAARPRWNALWVVRWWARAGRWGEKGGASLERRDEEGGSVEVGGVLKG